MLAALAIRESQDLPDYGRRAQVIAAGAAMAESGSSANRKLATGSTFGGSASGHVIPIPKSSSHEQAFLVDLWDLPDRR